MKYLKLVSLLSFIILFSYACNENGLTPASNLGVKTHKMGVKNTTSKKTSKDTTRLRYDNLPLGTSNVPKFVIQGNKWDHTDLTYYISNGTPNLTGSQIRQAISSAADLWANVTPLTFTEVNSASNADIVFTWTYIDGPGHILGAGYPPPPYDHAGQIYFDNGDTWTLEQRPPDSRDPIDLETIAAHELGHALGLKHSTNKNALMYPYYDQDGSHNYLSQDDIYGIREIYGSNFRVVINGPVNLTSGQVATWYAQVYRDNGDISYQWYRRNSTSDPWQEGSTTNSYQTYFYNTTSQPISGKFLKVTVTNRDGKKASAVKSLYILPHSRCNETKAAINSDTLLPNRIPPPCN